MIFGIFSAYIFVGFIVIATICFIEGYTDEPFGFNKKDMGLTIILWPTVLLFLLIMSLGNLVEISLKSIHKAGKSMKKTKKDV